MSVPLQIRAVPDDVHDALRSKAEREGLSLSAYALRVLERDARRPSLAEVVARTGGRAPGVTLDDVVAGIREDRGPLPSSGRGGPPERGPAEHEQGPGSGARSA